MVRNYKLFLFVQLIALSVVAPAFAGEEKESEGQNRQSRKARQAQLVERGRARALAREAAQGNGAAAADNAAEQAGCAGTGDLEELYPKNASGKSCGSCHACPSHQGDDQAASEITLTPQQIQAINKHRAAMEVYNYLNELEIERRNCCKKFACVIS